MAKSRTSIPLHFLLFFTIPCNRHNPFVFHHFLPSVAGLSKSSLISYLLQTRLNHPTPPICCKYKYISTAFLLSYAASLSQSPISSHLKCYLLPYASAVCLFLLFTSPRSHSPRPSALLPNFISIGMLRIPAEVSP